LVGNYSTEEIELKFKNLDHYWKDKKSSEKSLTNFFKNAVGANLRIIHIINENKYSTSTADELGIFYLFLKISPKMPSTMNCHVTFTFKNFDFKL
jgi:hypothetical protein